LKDVNVDIEADIEGAKVNEDNDSTLMSERSVEIEASELLRPTL
jgi:hypothetical protein